MIDGSTPATAIARIFARGCTPQSRALRPDITIIAAAPSAIWDEVPAVTVPLRGSNAGASCASGSSDASAAGTGSLCVGAMTVIGS